MTGYVILIESCSIGVFSDSERVYDQKLSWAIGAESSLCSYLAAGVEPGILDL